MANKSVDKSLRPEKKEDREPAYMEGYSEEDQAELAIQLGRAHAKTLTISERLFLWGKDAMPTVMISSRGARMLHDMIVQKNIGQPQIDTMRKVKVAAIHNPTDHIVRIDMPREAGCSTAIFPPGGKLPIDAYGDEFLGQVNVSGLRKIDYDPLDQEMNPPTNTGVGPSLDRRKTDPDFAALTEKAKTDKFITERPEVVPALQAAMSGHS